MREDGSPPIMLASRSPRRASILRELGIVFEVEIPEVIEIECGLPPDRMVLENALLKWRWCRDRHPQAAIVAADTTVVLDEVAIGKPGTRTRAFAMLRAASGRTHRVYTGYALGAADGEGLPACSGVMVSCVEFKRLRDEDIERYLDEVAPYDRAGAYDISDRGDWIVERYEGSLTNIMGLPSEIVKDWYATWH